MLPASEDPFGRIFLTVAGRVLATSGITVPTDVLSLGMIHFMPHFWVRLYGHATLEVFGRFPFGIAHTEPLFESMLSELAADVGISLP